MLFISINIFDVSLFELDMEFFDKQNTYRFIDLLVLSIFFWDNRYHVASSMMSLHNARSYCQERGQYLVPVNQYKTDYIRNLLPLGDVQAWLGLYQNDDMMWFTDYGRSEPTWFN